jgi:hypothetical protein
MEGAGAVFAQEAADANPSDDATAKRITGLIWRIGCSLAGQTTFL